MIYFSGENETVGDLMEGEEFDGSFDSYVGLFNKLNETSYSKPTDLIPPMTPLVLVSSPESSVNESKENVAEFKQFTLDERRFLRELQQEDFDLISHLGVMEVVEDLQGYMNQPKINLDSPFSENSSTKSDSGGSFDQFMDSLDEPLFKTRSPEMNESLTNLSMVDLFAETAGAATFALKSSQLHVGLEDLFGHMRKQLLLSRELALLERIDPSKRGADFFEKKRVLKLQVRETQGHIKRLLPKRQSTKVSGMLRKNTSFKNYEKIRNGKYFRKSVEKTIKQKGRISIKTLELDLLNKIGLKKLRFRVKISAGAKAAGDWLGPRLGAAAVVWDTKKTFERTGSPAKATATLAGGVASMLATDALIASAGSLSSLGVIAVGTLSGETALAGTLLVCSPVLGWVVLGAVGVAVVGYVGVKTAHVVEEAVNDVWDRYGEDVYKSVVEFIEEAGKEIQQAWRDGSEWVDSFYDSTKLQVEGAWEATSKWATSVYESCVGD